MSTTNDPADKFIEGAAKGAAKAGLEYTEEKIKKLVEGFRNRKISFVEDSDVIKQIQKQKRKAEWTLFNRYIINKDLRVLFQMGLTLRDYEKEKKDHEFLIHKIRKKYGKEGVHFAWFVQNGIFNKYISILMDSDIEEDQLKYKINSFLDNIDNYITFVSLKDKKEIEKKINEISIKITAHSPDLFILSSMGDAMPICEQIINEIQDSISKYDCELFDSPHKGRKIYFLIDQESNISI